MQKQHVESPIEILCNTGSPRQKRQIKTGPKYIKFKGWSVRYPLDAVVEYESKWLCEVN